jgi:hypothetical protein
MWDTRSDWRNIWLLSIQNHCLCTVW